jgi:hypothetical protein
VPPNFQRRGNCIHQALGILPNCRDEISHNSPIRDVGCTGNQRPDRQVNTSSGDKWPVSEIAFSLSIGEKRRRLFSNSDRFPGWSVMRAHLYQWLGRTQFYAFGEIVSQPILSRARATRIAVPKQAGPSLMRRATLLLLLIFLVLARLDAPRDLPGERERRCLHLIACMRALEWVATIVLLGWAGASYSLLRISARLTPQPPRLCAPWQRTTLSRNL